MMWDNTPPMKGINPIHTMNEHSFTFLLTMTFTYKRTHAPVNLPTLRHKAYLEGL
jgi:hypothetical protein